jgi:methylase of polypeptide subunit release factors
MLNGPTGNFCLDLTGEVSDKRAIAWSADVGHYVSVAGNDVDVQRWDASPSVIEKYSAQSVMKRLPEFHNYLEKSQPRYEQSVIPHAIRVFRQLRGSLAAKDGTPALIAFLTLLACVTDRVSRADLNLDHWSLSRREHSAAVAIKDNDWELLSDDLMRGRLLDQLILDPRLLLRHAAGQLFQEAHYEATVLPQLSLPGFGLQPVSVQKGVSASIGVDFTPPSLARMVVEQALRVTNLGKEQVRFLDPACGSGEFLREVLRQVRLSGFKGRIELLGFDISEAACAMARFVLTWEKNEDQYPVAVDIKCVDSLGNISWPSDVDLIVMNPPFVSYEQLTAQDLSRVRSTLGALTKGRVNLSAAFVWRAVTSVKESAVVATLIPASFLDATATSAMRNEMRSFLSPRFIARLGSQVLFRDVLVDAAALVVQKGPSHGDQNAVAFWADHRIESTVAGIRALRRAGRTQGSFTTPVLGEGFSIYKTPVFSGSAWSPRSYEAWQLLDRLRGMPTVGDLFSVHTGARPGYLPAFVIDKASWRDLPRKEQRYFRPAVVNESITCGFLRDVQYVFYPYGRYRLESEKELRAELGSYYSRVLQPSRQTLMRRASKREPSRWWEMSESRAWQHQAEPKLVSVYFGKAGSFAYDDSGDFVVVQGFAWLPKPPLKSKSTLHSGLSLAYSAILNSPIMNDFLAAVSNPVQGGQWDLSSRFVKNIPLPNLAKSDNSTVVETLTRLGRSLSRGADVNQEELKQAAQLAYGAFLTHG